MAAAFAAGGDIVNPVRTPDGEGDMLVVLYHSEVAARIVDTGQVDVARSLGFHITQS